jgi:hypothetical protein
MTGAIFPQSRRGRPGRIERLGSQLSANPMIENLLLRDPAWPSAPAAEWGATVAFFEKSFPADRGD